MFSLVKTLLKSLFEGFLSLIYKENCYICGCSKDNKILCKTCSKTVEILSGFPHRKIRGIKIYSACIYKDTVRTLIHKLKFQHKKGVAIVLAEFLFIYYNKILSFKQTDNKDIKTFQNAVIIPVPTTKKNIKIRGYNNVFEMVKEFSKLTNIKLIDNLLTRVKNSKPQFKMNKNQRKSNVKNAFKINSKYVPFLKNKTVIVIDDIITTGSTLEEVIKTLQENRINNIVCITLSKTV